MVLSVVVTVALDVRGAATVKTAVANELERAVNELQAAMRAAAWLAEQ